MDFATQFYTILRHACEKRGGQQELVNASGIGQPVLNRILSGKTKDPGLASIAAIIDALGYSLCINEELIDNKAYEKLKIANEEIKKLKEMLSKAQGEIVGLQTALEKIVEKVIASGNENLEKKYSISHNTLLNIQKKD